MQLRVAYLPGVGVEGEEGHGGDLLPVGPQLRAASQLVVRLLRLGGLRLLREADQLGRWDGQTAFGLGLGVETCVPVGG
ncbi:Hypothetical predicted protein [Cloeon dipterum]|uniref:Uncharacterized protein n=1 Tax=Cloeon dipterum TaxID=197152 RepID=A0A8S1D7C4_9INSE|nr:Hypothetical predicted protein [Cloeon dipterum]